MKKAIIIFALLPHFILAQKNFAPLDATWRYHQHNLNCQRDFLRYDAVAEIEIDDKDCTIIYAYRSQSLGPFWQTNDSLIIWENENKVYFYQFDEFHLLYDFTMEEGDTLDYFLPNNETLFFGPYQFEPQDTAVFATQLYVESVEEIEIDGLTYKKYDTRPIFSGDVFFNDMGTIIENVGSLNAKIIGDNLFYVAEGCGPGFQCYENDFFSYPDDVPCEYPTNTEEIYTSEEIKLFPNPTNAILHLENITGDKVLSIDLRSLTGERLISIPNHSESIDLSDLRQGMYLMSIQFESGNRYLEKILKH